MDPSAAPWRVLESTAPPDGTGAPGSSSSGPPARAFLVSPVTAAAVAGAVVLTLVAFLLASSSSGAGTVTVQGGGDVPAVRGVSPSASTGDGDRSAGAGEGIVVVEIVGAIRRPGVYRLPIGSRIGDLVEAAGGYGPRLDAGRASQELNLAARLADGDRVAVPSRDEAASSTTGTAGSGGAGAGGENAAAGRPLDLNRATSAELEALPGIGPVTAGKIITSREEQPFTTVDDLRTRKLVGAKTFDKLKDLIAVR